MNDVHDHGRGAVVTTWFVTRHAGALDWAKAHGIDDAQPIDHLDIAQIGQDDRVLGTLPVHLAAAVCARGARYLHLSLDIPEHRRGSELSAADMDAFGARLEEYRVERVENSDA